jgi:hypothetical protein
LVEDKVAERETAELTFQDISDHPRSSHETSGFVAVSGFGVSDRLLTSP